MLTGTKWLYIIYKVWPPCHSLYLLYTMSKKTAKLVLSELCQISTNCENFLHKIWQRGCKKVILFSSTLTLRHAMVANITFLLFLLFFDVSVSQYM